LIKEIHGVNNIVVVGVRKAESKSRAKRKEYEHRCIKGEDKILIKPIFNWSTSDVWEFINTHIGYHCALYDMGYHRIGCLLCPMANYKTHLKDLQVSPKIEYAYKKVIKKNIRDGRYSEFKDADDVFDWWIKGISVKEYFAIKNHNNFGL
jgi:phosphoadenosine phosphosulfate reductase